jgi:Putative adhesin
MSRTGKQALIAVLALSVLSFLVVGSFLGRTAEADTRLDQSVKRVELANGSGEVEIVGSDTSRIEVHERTRHRLWKPDQTFTVDGDTVRLNGDCGWGCSTDYTVRVPKGTQITGNGGSGDVSIQGIASDVDVKLSSGELEVMDLTGSLRADVGSGSITIERISGDVDAHTSSGEIELSEIAGKTTVDTGSGSIEGDLRSSDAVDARTSSGEITLEVAEAKSVRAKTGSGSIELTVPNRAYKIDATTGSGDIDHSGVREDDASEYAITASTGSGSIEIAPNN